jgi:hypothetical protein
MYMWRCADGHSISLCSTPYHALLPLCPHYAPPTCGLPLAPLPMLPLCPPYAPSALPMLHLPPLCSLLIVSPVPSSHPSPLSPQARHNFGIPKTTARRLLEEMGLDVWVEDRPKFIDQMRDVAPSAVLAFSARKVAIIRATDAYQLVRRAHGEDAADASGLLRLEDARPPVHLLPIPHLGPEQGTTPLNSAEFMRMVSPSTAPRGGGADTPDGAFSEQEQDDGGCLAATLSPSTSHLPLLQAPPANSLSNSPTPDPHLSLFSAPCR